MLANRPIRYAHREAHWRVASLDKIPAAFRTRTVMQTPNLKVMPIDLSNAWKSGERIINGAISLLPNLVIAITIFVLFIILASAIRGAVRHFVEKKKHHRSLAILLGQIAHLCVVILGFLIGLSVIAPSFQAGDLIKVLGIGSVAVGFAFQNILQNFLAGILILMQQPFQPGDWISVTGIEGNVDDIQTRATIVSTKSGHRVVIPNAVLFTNPVSVGREPEERPSAASA